MNCCIECFCDVHIRSTITKKGTVGDCDYCSSKSVFVLDIDDLSNPISELVTGLVQTYSVATDAGAKPLQYALRDDWDILSVGAETVLAITKKLCAATYPEDAEVFSRNVVIEQLTDIDFLYEYGVVSGYSWERFAESIKYGNRFHSGMFNADAFASFLSIIRKVCPAGSFMYRARISTDKNGFELDKMGAPPKEKRSAGRVNPDGIGVLYLSSDKETVLNEVRASAFDYVTIGRFRAKRDINVVNLSGVGKSSPFMYGNEFEKFAVNRRVFQEMADEIAKPLRRTDSSLEYLPTQFISEYIKSQNYDGVEFSSTLRQGGYNLAVFDESLFECVDVETVEVSEVLYNTNPAFSK